jgi:hypothetical protein
MSDEEPAYALVKSLRLEYTNEYLSYLDQINETVLRLINSQC